LNTCVISSVGLLLLRKDEKGWMCEPTPPTQQRYIAAPQPLHPRGTRLHMHINGMILIAAIHDASTPQAHLTCCLHPLLSCTAYTTMLATPQGTIIDSSGHSASTRHNCTPGIPLQQELTKWADALRQPKAQGYVVLRIACA
jgi:hypothetical protein